MIKPKSNVLYYLILTILSMSFIVPSVLSDNGGSIGVPVIKTQILQLLLVIIKIYHSIIAIAI